MTSQSLTDDLHHSLLSWQSEETATGIKFSGSYRFSADFLAFRGHFPEQPVLPAIVQLAAVRQLAERSLNKKLLTSGCERIKFRGVVGAEQVLDIMGTLIKEDKGWQVQFKLRHDTNKIADGSLMVQEA